MQNLSLQTSVGEWVAKQPAVARVFEALQIDYCCGGQKSLEQACRERSLDTNDVLEKITAVAQASPPANEERWPDRTLTELCDHIEQTHHAYLKTELSRLEGIIAKVFAAHGANHPALQEVRNAFADLKAELEPHMFKEERILFPAIRQLEQAEGKPHFPFGTVGNPIRMMEHEHEHAGAALQRIRQATADFQVPNDACNTYRVMLVGLEQLELNMHQHVHKENNILFPRAILLQQS